MSMSEFYFSHGPSHAQHMGGNFPRSREENLYRRPEERESNEVRIEPFGGTNGGQVPSRLHDTTNTANQNEIVKACRKRQRNFVLDESSLDDLAARHGYTKIHIALTSAPLASYRRGVCRLNFWLTTGNVGSYLDHPTKGKTLLVRRDINLNEAESVFQNPMHQIGRDYRRSSN